MGRGRKQPRPQGGNECFPFSVPICSPPPHPTPKFSDGAQTCGQPLYPRASFFFFFNLISRVSYLYIVMLMSNSCGADGRGVSGSQSLWISLPITHLAPVAISPRALWWRRPLRRPLGAGAFAFFFFFPGLRVPPICLAHECAPVTAASSTPRSLPGSGAGVFHLCPFSSSPPPARALLLLWAPPQHTPHPPSIGRSRLHLFPEYHFNSCLGLR